MSLFQKMLFRKANQVIIDIVIFGFSWVAAYFLRFEGPPAGRYLDQMLWLALYVVAARALLFYGFSVYTIVWRYISVRDAFLIVKAAAPLSVVLLMVRLFTPVKLAVVSIPISIIILEFLMVVLGAAGVRMVRRLMAESKDRERLTNKKGEKHRNILLIGAGDAGNLVVRELQRRADLGMNVVGFVDDDPDKKGMNIQGVRVLGDSFHIPQIAQALAVNEAIITIVNASSKDIRRIVEICESAGIKVRIVPGLFEMLDERITITKVRDVNIDDLLGRSVFQMEKHLPEVAKAYRGKRILVTGAGGSIGSELCRQLVAMGPKEIVLLDKDENSIFEIDADLDGSGGRGRHGVVIHPVIANIKNADRMRHLFERFRPEIVFHAAAHKHVPLMELNIAEAVINNVLGTKNVVEAAVAVGVERFIFISTDKAVNPTSVMGATKKIGEAIVQGVAKGSATKFSCVRFGNVLGSRGSVVPLFRKQIARGGPVTVTHPEVRRYFMSIAEAVHLIIQSGTLGENGEIFVLDMGQPIKIVDMVKALIRLSGNEGEDIEIKYIGMRPGEKLYEEILIEEERTRATKFEKIFIAPPVEAVNGNSDGAVGGLIEAAVAGDEEGIIKRLEGMGIGYRKNDPAAGNKSGRTSS